MNKFEKALLKYGAKTLIDVRDLSESLELYEDCADINEVLAKHDIKTTFDADDWRNEFWKKGANGDIAFLNLPYYYHNAIVGIYGQGFIDSIIAKYDHIQFKQI